MYIRHYCDMLCGIVMSMFTQTPSMKHKSIVPRWLMMNSRGEVDGMWTLLVISFVTTTFAYVASLVEVIEVGDFTLAFRSFDALGYAAVVLVPLIGGYFGRRYTKAQADLSIATARVYAETSKSKQANSRQLLVERSTDTQDATVDVDTGDMIDETDTSRIDE